MPTLGRVREEEPLKLETSLCYSETISKNNSGITVSSCEGSEFSLGQSHQAQKTSSVSASDCLVSAILGPVLNTERKRN